MNLVKFVIIVFTLPILFFSCTNKKRQKLQVKNLSCEYLINPVGIESQNPEFSWQIQSDKKEQFQKAYQILVASNLELLNKESADVWNSGKRESEQSIWVKFKGKELLSTRKYYWKVKIWMVDSNSSTWSEPATFEMGLLNEADWQNSEWINMEKDTRKSEHRYIQKQNQRMKEPKTVTSNPGAYFRKEFHAKKPIKNAQAYVSALGYFELYVNGKKVGKNVLDPAPTSYDKRSLYVIHNVTDLLSEKNAVGLILGNGFYGQNIAFTGNLDYGKPAIKMILKVEYEDGTIENVISNSNWKCSTGPIVFDNVYAGETYDARFELPGWNKPDFDDSTWQTAKIATPAVGELKAQILPPIKKIKELEPVNIFKGSNENWIVDFGQNISGWVKIKVKEERGKVITVKTTEALTRKGDKIHPGSLGAFATGVNQTDIYICKAENEEIWEPRFTYQGFQFAEIEGLSNPPSKESVTAVLVHNDVKPIGSFECSDSLLNKMYEVSKWTVVDNLHGFPEDCPHREKCGWLGDAHATAQFSMYNYDMLQFYRKYMEDIRSQIGAAGGKPIPCMIAPGKRIAGEAKLDWGIAMIYLPWYSYLHYGDLTLAKSHFTEMKDFIDYMFTFRNEKGIIENGMGDWCPPRWDRQTNPGAMECHPFISANAYFYDGLKIMQEFAKLLGEKEYAQFVKKEADNIKQSFNSEFLAEIETGKKWYGSQTATVMALQFGMVPESKKEMVLQGLKHDIKITHKGHHSTGIHGNRYIYSVLCDESEEDLSYPVLTHPEFPSQAYILNSGLTTWPERQWKWDSGIEWDRSLNHPMQAGFAAFFHETVAGIKPLKDSPGFKEFVIRPGLTDKLDYAQAATESPYGTIKSHWISKSEAFVLNVDIPVNSSAHIVMRTGTVENISIAGKNQRYIREHLVGTKHDKTTLRLGSGSYTIEIKK